MGRGQGDDGLLRGDGEIPLLDADRLSDHTSDYAPEQSGDSSYGSPEDDRAIRSIIGKLSSTAAFKNKSSEEIENQAIELYNRSCQQALSPSCSKEQLAKIATLFSEKPESLRERLLQDRGTEDLGGSEGGAAALLRALRD